MTPVAAPATAGSSTASQGANPVASLSANFGDFLRLLMTQLKNQDPTSPMDANQFTSELVQFSSVEQQINTNSSLTQLIQLTQAADLTQSSGILGKQITVRSSQMPLQGGIGTLKFTAPTAGPVSITLSNASGIALRQVTMKATQGANTWNWDGMDGSGRQLPDGAYTVSVTSGAASTGVLPFTVVGTATGVSTQNTGVNLQLGALSVPFTAVASVGN